MRKYRSAFSLSQGFTLVELLVVIAIIGILATLLLLQLGTARAKARDARRIADINQVKTAMELYLDDNGSYPATNVYATLQTNLTSYLSKVPNDPSRTCTNYDGASDCYGYAWNPAASPTAYHLYAELERYAASALTADRDFNSTGWSGAAKNLSTAELPANDCSVAGTSLCTFDLTN